MGDGVAVLLVPVPEFVGVAVAVDEFPTRASSKGSWTTAAWAVPFTQLVKLSLVPETKLTVAHCKERSQELAAKPREFPQDVLCWRSHKRLPDTTDRQGHPQQH